MKAIMMIIMGIAIAGCAETLDSVQQADLPSCADLQSEHLGALYSGDWEAESQYRDMLNSECRGSVEDPGVPAAVYGI